MGKKYKIKREITRQPVSEDFTPFLPDPNSPCILEQAIPERTTNIYLNSPVEISISVNPASPRHVVAVWQQGRTSTGSAMDIGVGYSKNGGKSWKQTLVPFNSCKGGISQRASDPIVRYSSDGQRVFLSVLIVNIDPQFSGIAVASSDDNGKTWNDIEILYTSCYSGIGSLPVPPDCTTFTPDRPILIADPNDSCYAYDTWFSYDPTDPSGFRTDISFARTKNQGKTWKVSPKIYGLPQSQQDLCDQGRSNCSDQVIVQLPDVVVLPKCKSGDLVLLFNRQYAAATNPGLEGPFFPYDFAVIRSNDRGKTWSEHAKPATPILNTPDFGSGPLFTVYTGGYVVVNGIAVQGLGDPVRDGSLFIHTVADQKTGFLYAVFQDFDFRPDRLSQIALIASYDGGYTWTQPIRINRTPQDAPNPQAFTSMVSVNDQGVLAVTYKDFRFDPVPTGNPNADYSHTLTDAWIAFYKVKCGKICFIKELRLSPESYIMQNGPFVGLGYMTNGDYDDTDTNCSKFYSLHAESLSGPFAPPINVVVNPGDPPTEINIFVDKQTEAYIDVIKVEKKKKK